MSLASEASRGPDKTKITYKYDLSVLALVMGARRVYAMQNHALKHTREMQSGLVCFARSLKINNRLETSIEAIFFFFCQ